MMSICLIAGDINFDFEVSAGFHQCFSLVINKYLGEDTLRLCLEMPCFSLIVIHQLAFLGGSCLRQLLL